MIVMSAYEKTSYGSRKYPPLPAPSPLVQRHIRLLNLTPATPMAGRTVLDLGCGTGRDSLALAKRSFKVFGIDNDPAKLRVAESRRAGQPLEERNCRFVEADIRELPEFEEPFDSKFGIVTMINVLDNLSKEEQREVLQRTQELTTYAGLHLVSAAVESGDMDVRYELPRAYEANNWKVDQFVFRPPDETMISGTELDAGIVRFRATKQN